jgi:type I restriction enzyme S subunit
MNYVQLKDVCVINMGQSPDSNSYNDCGEGLPFFQGNADFGEMYPVTRKWCSSPTKIASENDILISVRAPIGALNYAKESCCIGRGLAALTPNKSKVSPAFIFWLLKSKNEELNSKGTGSTFKAIGRKVLEETLIPNISLGEQIVCAKALEKIYYIMQTCQQQLQKLDDLVKARFVEMFGELHYNRHGFKIVSVEEVCTMVKDGTHQTPQYTTDDIHGFKFLSSKDVMSQKVDWKNIKYISSELHEKLYSTLKPQRDDILMSKNGVNYGVAAINDSDEVFDIYVSLALLRPKPIINPIYFRCVLNNPDTKEQFDSSIKGIGVPNLHLGEIKKTKILLPPIKLQNQFAAFVHQVDKSKVAVQKSLDEAQLLFDSLMQQYFG